jgi:hypothetical protein
MKSIRALLARATLIGLLFLRPLLGEIKPGTYQLARPATMEILTNGKIVGKMVLAEGRTIELVSVDHDKGLIQSGTGGGYISLTPADGLFVGVEPSATSSDGQGKDKRPETTKITPGTYQLARTVPLEILEGTKIVGKMDLSAGDKIQLVSVNGDKGLVHFGRDVAGYISLKPAEGLFVDVEAQKAAAAAQAAAAEAQAAAARTAAAAQANVELSAAQARLLAIGRGHGLNSREDITYFVNQQGYPLRWDNLGDVTHWAEVFDTLDFVGRALK